MKIQNNKLIADKRKVFRCKCHGIILGNEIYLKEIMKDGKLEVDTPYNYEEIDKPVREEIDHVE